MLPTEASARGPDFTMTAKLIVIPAIFIVIRNHRPAFTDAHRHGGEPE
jgi:hypothetical protein